MSKKKNIWFAAGCVFIGLVAVFVRFYRLGQIPYGIHIDEAGMGYDAWCIANYGMDRYQNSYPLYFINFGQGQNALYTYLYALILKITGGVPDPFTMRLPAALVGLLMVLCSMKLGEWAFGKGGCLTAGLITAVCPVYIMSSRWALESYLMYGVCTLAVTSLAGAVRAGRGWKKNLGFVCTGLLMGLSLYTYAMAYIVLPFFLLFALAYLLYLKKISLLQIVGMGIPIGIMAMPLILMLLINSRGLGTVSIGCFTIPALPEYRGGDITFSHFLLSPIPMLKSMFFNDYLGYSAYDGFYTLYIISLPFALVGLVTCAVRSVCALRERRFDVQALILCFFLAVMLMGRFINGAMANINQINAVFFPLWFFIMDGIWQTGSFIRKVTGQRLYYGGVAAAYLVSLVFFLNTYWVKEPVTFQMHFQRGWDFIRESCEYKVCYADYGGQKIYYLYDTVPDPGQQIFTLDHQEYYGNVNCYVNQYTVIDPENVYIVQWSNEEWMDKLRGSDAGFKEKGFDGYTVFYK